MKWDLQVVGATVVTPRGRGRATIAIRDGKVAGLLDAPDPQARQTLDATGLVALPGMVDQHVHFMEPGDPSREDFVTGSSAAAAGGVTTVVEHTHGHPVLTPADLEGKRAHLGGRSLVDFGLAAHVVPGNLEQAGPLLQAGAAFLKVFTCTTHGIDALMADQVLDVMRDARRLGGRLLVHCEDEFITAANERRLKAAGLAGGEVISLWRSPEAELSAVAMVCALATSSGAGVTVAHASSPSVVDQVRLAKRLNARVAVEACPQYLHLTDDEAIRLGPLRKFTPPARSAAEVEGMREKLSRGELDLIASDHAPSTLEQKRSGDIYTCPFGLPGVETTLKLFLNACAEGWLTLEQLVMLYSERPARLLGLYPRKGSLGVGSDADLVLVDLRAEQTLGEVIHSRAGWTPYQGVRVRGVPRYTLLRGRIVVEDGRLVAEPGWGRYLSPSRA